MLTKKEFIDAYEAKGMPRSWGESEWARRLNDDAYTKGVDPECHLITMAATVHVQAITFNEYAKGRHINEKSKEKKAAPGEAKQMMREGFFDENMADMSSPGKATTLTHDQLLGLSSARETAQASFWADPLMAAAEKESASHEDAADGSSAKRQRTAGGDGHLDLDVIDVKENISRMIKAAFAKVNAAKKTAMEELQKSESNRVSYEDTYIQLLSRTNAMSWLLDKTEAEYVELLKKAGEDKHPLPVGEAMVGDLHTKAWFEATSHVIFIRVSRPLISLISYAFDSFGRTGPMILHLL